MSPPQLILLADDSSISLRIMSEYLRKLLPDTYILVTSHAGTVIDITVENVVRAIFTDLMFISQDNNKANLKLQGVDIIKIIREYQKDANLPEEIPIVAFSADPSKRESALQAGASMFLPKPIKMQDLSRALTAFGIT